VECRVSAQIFNLNDYRAEEGAESEIDLVTAVDAAIRDLREIKQCWGTDAARQRVEECEAMLRRAFAGA
jgi:hypothetical protein